MQLEIPDNKFEDLLLNLFLEPEFVDLFQKIEME